MARADEVPVEEWTLQDLARATGSCEPMQKLHKQAMGAMKQTSHRDVSTSTTMV